MSHPLTKMTPDWFLGVSASLASMESRIPLKVESIHAHGGYFGGGSPSLGDTVELEFETASGASCLVKSWVTHSGDGRFGAAFLSMLDLTPGPSRGAKRDRAVPCPADYPPLAWANHPFYDPTRLQFRVTGFFASGMALSFTRDDKTPIEGLPLEMTLVLPGLETLHASARVAFVELNDGPGASRCDVELVKPEPALLSAIGRYLFSTSDDLSVETLEGLGYPVPEFEYASRFGLAHTPAEIRDMLALRLLAYRSRPGANLAGVTEPEQMRDAFDDHSLILSVHVGNKPVGTGRIVFNDGDPRKTEIGRFVDLPKWLWDGGFVECSRVATSPGIRRRDVFSTISRHTLRIAYQTGVRYILADCEAHLLEPYKRRGAQELGLTFVHPLEGKTLHVIYSDVDAILAALERQEISWKTLWRAVE